MGLASLSASVSLPCTIFTTRGAGHVLVGNNEDDAPGRITYLWFKPNPSIGYVLWGHREETPEGGMNDQGLFFDAAALPTAVPVAKRAGRQDFNGYAVEPVLSQCRSVAEALSFLGRLNLLWQDKAQIFLADKTGDCAIVHANWVVRKGLQPNFVLTNHRLDVGHPEHCWRRSLAMQMLESNRLHDLTLVKQILCDTAQRDLSNQTLYSDAVDLTAGTFTIYNDRRYDQPVTLNLETELRKGYRVIEQSSLFMPSLSEYVALYGVGPALKRWELKTHPSPDEYSQAGYALLRSGRLEDALLVFRASIGRVATAKGLSDLANALQLLNRTQESRILYRAALARDASDYSANLMAGKRGLVTFRLREFETAESVEVVGSFSKQPLKLRRKSGEWFGQLALAKGTYTYALHVDDSWTTDPNNGLARKTGKWWGSLLVLR